MKDGEYECSGCRKTVNPKEEGIHRARIEIEPAPGKWRTFKPGGLICKECSKE